MRSAYVLGPDWLVDRDVTDDPLVLAAANGDPAALQELLLLYTPELVSHIASKLPASVQSVIDAEDVLQQTFIQAFRDISRFEPRSDRSFLSWLKAIAEHRAQDAVKSLHRHKRGGEFVQIRLRSRDSSRSMVDLVELLSAESHTPSESVAGHEAVEAVQRAIDALPQDYQQAVRLYLLQGKSLSETAALMNRTPRAVKSMVDRAKKKMRAFLGRMSLYK
jgi:RNA polymerase sigma-70 factor (ECF subfamily)